MAEPTRELIEDVRALLYSRAWTDFYTPELEKMRDLHIAQLVNPTTERLNNFPDDYLRGCIHTVSALLRMGQTLINSTDAADEQEQRLHAQDAEYDERADVGSFSPLPPQLL